MAEPPPHTPPADAAADKAEAASAAAVLQALVKAERAFAIYLPNNPLHEKFFGDFVRRIHEHLERFGPLHLTLAHDRILCCGETVYTTEERRENLAFRLFADGVRAVAIEPEVEAAELRALVDALRQPAVDTGEDDIVTRLWSADLRHVRTEIVEMPLAGGDGLAGLLPPGAAAGPGVREAQAGMIRRCAAELAAGPPASPTPPLPQQIFLPEEYEIEALQELVAAEQRRSPVEDLAGILEAIIAAETDPATLEEFLDIVARLCGDLLATGQVRHAVTLIGMLAWDVARPGLPSERAAAIDRARGRILTPDVFDGFARRLAGAEPMDRGALRELVVSLGTAAVEPFCRILGEVGAKETRRILIDALAETGRERPELFLPFLGDPRWYLVRNTIYILRRIANPEVAREVRRCVTHKDQRVRKEALLFFEETDDAAIEPLLLSFLADESPALRIAAARGLARRRSAAGAERLLAAASAEAFAQRDRAEREAVWEAAAEIAPQRSLPLLREMLLRRRWFGQARELEETASAVAGLRRIGTPEALELLRRAAASKRGRARELVEAALRGPAPAAGEGAAGDRGGKGPERG